MNIYRRLLLDPDPNAAGGGPTGGTTPLNDFVKSLPVDLQSEKSLHNMTDTATLAKGFVHAQRLIGTKRLPAPDGTWSDAQWNEHYDAVGRPKTAADYVVPEFKFESDPTIKIDETRMKGVKESLHAAGLSQRQADAVLKTYLSSVDADIKVARQIATQARAASEEALKKEWGDKYDIQVDLAKSVVTKFGDAEFMDYVNGQGGNDPRLIKSLAKIGAAMMEDKSRGGNAADGLQITDATRAQNEIDRLKTDKEFIDAYLKKDHPGHKAAVQQMMNLHKIVAPNKQVEPS